jgi:hypothetical protein
MAESAWDRVNMRAYARKFDTTEEAIGLMMSQIEAMIERQYGDATAH